MTGPANPVHRPQAVPSGLSAPGFVGRDRECATLRAALAGPPGMTLVEGEAGIGKSRLLREVLAARPRGAGGVLVAACPPFRQPYTLGPVVDALRGARDGVAGVRLSALAGALRPLFPEWAGDLPPAPEPAEDATAARHRLFRALAELVDGLGVSALVVEDAHWADDATLEFLLFLVSRHPQRISLVVTYRPEDVPRDSLLRRLPARLPSGAVPLRVALEPLDVEQTATLISSMLTGQQVSQGFATLLCERTDGVPLAIEESVRLLYDRADLTHRPSGWSRRHLDRIVVPPTVRDAVLERVGRLDAPARTLLHAAAVLAEASDDATLFTVADQPAQAGRVALAAVLESGLLQEAGGLFGYRHVLASRAVHDAIPAPTRRAMHACAGRVLEGRTPTPVGRLVRHFREAGERAAWTRYAERAVDLALASGDEATAATLVHDLLTTADLPVATVVELVRRTPSLMVTGQSRTRDLIGVLRSALDREPASAADEARARYLLAGCLSAVGEGEASEAEMRRAVRGLPPGSIERVRAMTRLGMPITVTATAAEHLRWLRRAAAAAESDATPPGQRLGLLVDRVHALLVLGEPSGWDEAERIPDTPATPQERMRVAVGHVNLGDLAMRWGRYAEAARRMDLAEDIAERFDYPRLRDVVRVNRAHLRWFAGKWDGLGAEVEALASVEDVHPLFAAEALLVLSLLEIAAGGGERTGERLGRVLDEYSAHGALEYLPAPAAALARLHLDASDVDGALRVTEEPLRIVARKRVWLWATDLAPVRVDALVAAGDVAGAADLVRSFARGLGDRDAPAPRASLVLCRAALAAARGQHSRAAAAFGRAARAWQAMPRPYDALLARERQARAHLAAGRRDGGLELLGEVHRGLLELGATADAERAGRHLRQHGVVPVQVWRGGRRGYGKHLSPRELEVVRLVATGRTNQEIARVLCRSPKTVASQVKSAMRKLDVTSRTALAVRAVEAGVVPDGSAGPG